MTLQGDLSTLELGDLLQNLETHERTGILTVQGAQGASHLYFSKGRLSLLTTDGRPGLMDALVASGTISQDDLESARKRQKRVRKFLGEILVAKKVIAPEVLLEIATARLLDEACELIAADLGAFTFTESKIPRGVFDPEERRLNMSLAAGPLLMEAARREDHWRLIRQRVPTDAVHYIVPHSRTQPVAAPSDIGTKLLSLLDGTRSVGEVMTSFPHCRFQAYQTLADFVEARAVRIAGADDMVELAKRLARSDVDRAWQVINRGLEAHPHHLSLLLEQALVAEDIGELETAAEALKMIIHMHLESGENAEARKEIERAKRIAPSDTSLWERSMQLAVEENRTTDAMADGEHLAKLYRVPGLHRKAWKVYEKLVDLDPVSWNFRKELAHSQADCGELAIAIEGLKRYGKHFLSRGEFDDARPVYEEIQALDPSNEEASETLSHIDNGVLQRKRVARKRLVRRASAIILTGLVATGGAFEMAARQDYSHVQRLISQKSLIERGRYKEAIRLLEDVAARFPLTTVGLYDVQKQIDEYQRKLGSSSAEEAGPADDLGWP